MRVINLTGLVRLDPVQMQSGILSLSWARERRLSISMEAGASELHHRLMPLRVSGRKTPMDPISLIVAALAAGAAGGGLKPTAEKAVSDA